jgi:hypothetical protein
MKKLFERFIYWCSSKDVKVVRRVVDIPDYPLTISNDAGEVFHLGREVFEHVPGQDGSLRHEIEGKFVCKISGIDNSPVSGYHFSDGWTTICPIDANRPMWLGVKTSELVQLN